MPARVDPFAPTPDEGSESADREQRHRLADGAPDGPVIVRRDSADNRLEAQQEDGSSDADVQLWFG